MASSHSNLTFHRLLEPAALELQAVNRVDDKFLSLLQIAAREGQFDNVLKLLKAEANVDRYINLQNRDDYIQQEAKKSALYFAIEREHHFIAGLLVLVGANVERAIATAEELNQIEIKRSLQQLTYQPAIMRAALVWAIKENALSLFEMLLVSAKKMLEGQHAVYIDIQDEMEEQKSVLPSSYASKDAFSEMDIAGLIEYACFKKKSLYAKRLLSLINGQVRRDIAILNAGYWAAVNVDQDLFNQVAPTDGDVAWTLFQLFKNKQDVALIAQLRNASKNALKQYGALVENELSANVINQIHFNLAVAELNFQSKDWVALTSLNLNNIPTLTLLNASHGLKYFLLIYSGEDIYKKLLNDKLPLPKKIQVTNEFRGIFSYAICRQLKIGTTFQMKYLEKEYINLCPLSQDKKKLLIMHALQDRYQQFDLSSSSAQSLLASCLTALSIHHEIISAENTFTTLSAGPVQMIIDCLNAFDQHQLEQANRWIRGLVHHPDLREKRLILRNKGQDDTEYSKLCKQILLMEKILELAAEEVAQKGFCSHRKTTDLIHFLLMALLVGLLVVSAYYFHYFDSEKDFIQSEMKNFPIHISYATDHRHYEKDTTCFVYVDWNTEHLRCMGEKSLYLYQMAINPSCQIFCDDLNDIYSGGSWSVAGVMYLSIILYVYVIVAFHKNMFNLRDESRFGDVNIKNFSNKLVEAFSELIAISTETDHLRLLTLKSSLQTVKSTLLYNQGIFSTKKTELEEKLNIHKAKLSASRVVIEEIDDEEKKEAEVERVPALDEDSLSTSLLRRSQNG